VPGWLRQGASIGQNNERKIKLKKDCNNLTISTTILSALACFALASAPNAFGVSPSPDGCYPNFTTAEGCNALNSLTTGAGNSGLGWYALFSDTDANYNTGVGAGALALTTTGGDSNTAVGAAALLLNTTGFENVAVGTNALVLNDTGQRNDAVGAFALSMNIDGSFNTALGRCALLGNTDGSNNTAVGYLAGMNQTTGSNNTYIGDPGVAEESNVIRIGNIAASGTDYEAFYVGGVVGVGIPMVTAVPVYIDTATGQLGTVPIDASGKAATPRVRGGNGAQPQAMLNHKVTELQATVAQQQKQIETLTAQLKEQAAQIQKVSAQLEVSKPAPQVVVNKP